MPGRQTVAAVALLLALGAMAPARTQSLEYQVKANYLVRFAAFIDWPPAAFASAGAPLTICVAGRDPFGRALDEAAAAQTAHGRRLAVRRIGERPEAAGCHILYRGRGTAAALPDSAATLVVSDSAVSAARGTIHFVISGNRVRFQIDRAAAERAKLAISSRLLALAVNAREGG